MKKIFLFFMIFVLLVIPFSSINGNSEELKDFYSNKKQFNYMDVNTVFSVYNNSDNNQTCGRILGKTVENIYSHEYLIGIGGENYLKPTKTIKFDNLTHYLDLMLFTKYVYQWNENFELKFDIYYEDKINISYPLPIYYDTYMSEVLPDNSSNQYSLIENGLQHYTTTSQMVFQRQSNLVSENQTENTFSEQSKFYSVGNSLNNIDTQNITYYDYENIQTNRWTTISLKPESFIWNNHVLNSFEFMNIGLERKHYNHIILIKNMHIIVKNPKDEFNNVPFLELYEFKEINNNWTNRVLFQVDLIQNTYQALRVRPIKLTMYNGQLTFYHDGIQYWQSSELKVDNETAFNYFCGYQFYLTLDENGYYHVYIHYKYSYNSRDSNKELHYNYSYTHIIIEDRKYAYLWNYDYYDDRNNTDIQIGHLPHFMKWDIIDSEIRKIDYDENNEVILIHDIDSGGLRFPSISDLRKMVEKALSPITTVIINLKNEILKPVESIISQLDNLLDGISDVTNTIGTLLSEVTVQFNAITNLITSEFTDITTLITNNFNSVIAQLGTITGKIDDVITIINSVVTELGNI